MATRNVKVKLPSFYTHRDFGGNDWMELDKPWDGFLHGDPHPTYHQNKISSFEVPEGWTVWLYKDPYHNNAFLKAVGPAAYTVARATDWWNDITRSIWVEKNAEYNPRSTKPHTVPVKSPKKKSKDDDSELGERPTSDTTGEKGVQNPKYPYKFDESEDSDDN